MINHFQHLERYEGEAFGIRARASWRTRAPTADPDDNRSCWTGDLPLVIFGDRPGQEIEYPMAVVILGGLVTSTLLNLFVLPVFYLRFGRAKLRAVA